jgi:hypothetical protein
VRRRAGERGRWGSGGGVRVVGVLIGRWGGGCVRKMAWGIGSKNSFVSIFPS